MNKDKLKEILDKHKLWLDNKAGGERADLRNADLSNAYLSYANLSNAYLSNADLSNADLRNAYLSYADLRNAYLSNAILPNFGIIPEEGDFICWGKKRGFIVKLLIPKEAKRISRYLRRSFFHWRHAYRLDTARSLDKRLRIIRNRLEKYRDEWMAIQQGAEPKSLQKPAELKND